MDYHKESLIAGKGTNIPGAIAEGGRAYRKYVSSMLLDELLDKLEDFNPSEFTTFVPYVVFLQLGMNYSVSVGLSAVTLEDQKLDEIRQWLVEQCRIIHEDSEKELVILNEVPNLWNVPYREDTTSAEEETTDNSTDTEDGSEPAAESGVSDTATDETASGATGVVE